MSKILNRFRNKGLWLSIFAFIPMVAQSFGWHGIPSNYSDVVNSLLSILIVAGILNNPQSGNWYLNDKNQVVENGIPVEEEK